MSLSLFENALDIMKEFVENDARTFLMLYGCFGGSGKADLQINMEFMSHKKPMDAH